MHRNNSVYIFSNVLLKIEKVGLKKLSILITILAVSYITPTLRIYF